MARQAVAKNENSNLAVITDERPDYLNESSVRGNEEVQADDLSLPRLQIIQDLSPQRKKTQPEYIEGAEEGMVFNTISNRLYVGPITVVPVLFRKEFIIWKDRDSGGGFRGAYPSAEDAHAAMVDLEDGSDCEVVDTAQHFCLVVNEDTIEESVISMSKSQMKVSRQLNSLARMAGGDRFSNAYSFEAVAVDGPKGNYFNWKIKRLGYVSEPVYRQGEALYEAVKSGERDVSRGETRGTESTDDSEY